MLLELPKTSNLDFFKCQLLNASLSFTFLPFLLFAQGADKETKGPDGFSAFEAAESDAIKALLK